MRYLRLLLPLLLLCLVMPVGGSSAETSSAPTAPRIPTLVDIRAAHHPGFDRIVFEFRGGVPSGRQVRYVDRLVGDASGLPVPIAGQAILQVRLEPAQAHNTLRQTVPQRMAFPLPTIMTAARSGDFEAVTTYGIGLAKRSRYHIATLRHPDRLVIDIAANFRTVQRKVWFFNQKRYLDNREPFFTPRLRPVLPTTPAQGVMDRLFAGVTPAEHTMGLRLLGSSATGYKNLSISNKIARVHLTGRCASGGSTVTIAGQIMPALRQFPTVDWVKIYDAQGRTESPTGRRDSIPTCLEP